MIQLQFEMLRKSLPSFKNMVQVKWVNPYTYAFWWLIQGLTVATSSLHLSMKKWNTFHGCQRCDKIGHCFCFVKMNASCAVIVSWQAKHLDLEVFIQISKISFLSSHGKEIATRKRNYYKQGWKSHWDQVDEHDTVQKMPKNFFVHNLG